MSQETATVLDSKPEYQVVTSESIRTSKREQVNLLREFLLTKKIEGCSKLTIRQYNDHILKLINWSQPKDVRELSAKELRQYLYEYQEVHNVSNGTLNGMRLVLSSFYGFLEDEDYIIKNPCRRIHKIKSEEVVRTPFTDEEIEKIRRGCDNLRDLCIIDLLYSSGMRISELISIDIKDMNFDEREVIVKGKGHKERICYFDARTKIELLDYLNTRIDREPALFVTRREPARRVGKGAVERFMKVLQAKTGVENIHPHRFRRTLATNLLSKGMTLEQVQIVLGHRRIETTLIYTSINKDNIKLCHQKYMS